MADIEEPAVADIPSTFLEIVTNVRSVVLVVAPSPPPSSVVSVEYVDEVVVNS